MQTTSLAIRLSLLAAIVLTLGIDTSKALSYAPLLSLPGAKELAGESALLQIGYGVLITLPPIKPMGWLRPQFATVFGAGGGAVQVVHLIVERFSSAPRPWDGIITLAFMLATFLMWGFAGCRARSVGLLLLPSLLASIWSAIVTMTIAVLAGTLLEFFIAPIPLDQMRTWAEFQRSGWTDLAAFSIANTIDNASTHLIIGPVVACIFGTGGYGLWQITHRRPSQQKPEPTA
jgi:hypothetical protein